MLYEPVGFRAVHGLQRGALLAEGSYEEVSSNTQVMEAYMGTTDGQLQGAH